MRNAFMPAIASALLAVSCLDAAPVRAQSIVTYVSGKGADSGSCTPQSSPCRSFAYALTQTLPGGEIKALDPDGYGPVNITQAVSLIGVEGAGINRTSGTHITINAGPSDAVTIANLILDGGGAATNGIFFITGGSLTIKNCVVQNFTGDGIALEGAGANILMTDVVSSGNAYGIYAVTAGGSLVVVLDRFRATNNQYQGVRMVVDRTPASYSFTVVDSVFSNNNGDGFLLDIGATLLLSQSTATGNAGYGVNCGGTCQSAGNNFIYGNASGNVSGTLTNVGTQ